MELGTTIVGVLILLACMVPFIVVSISSKLRNKKKLQELISYAQEHKYEITTHELWGESAIGMDNNHSTLFFISKEQETKVFQQLNLLEIESCKINTISNNMRSKSSNYTVIEKIELILPYKQQHKGQVSLIFYSAANHNLTVAGELAIAAKWNTLINEKIDAVSLKASM